MSKFKTLRQNPPTLKVKDGAREVIITTVSAMCDNVHRLKLKKNEFGEFRLRTMGYALSNWQLEYPREDIEWAADDNEWDEVFQMINSGTSVIESIKSR